MSTRVWRSAGHGLGNCFPRYGGLPYLCLPKRLMRESCLRGREVVDLLRRKQLEEVILGLGCLAVVDVQLTIFESPDVGKSFLCIL